MIACFAGRVTLCTCVPHFIVLPTSSVFNMYSISNIEMEAAVTSNFQSMLLNFANFFGHKIMHIFILYAIILKVSQFLPTDRHREFYASFG